LREISDAWRQFRSPAEVAAFFASETALWGKLIKDTGAKAQ
jgi:hypothetical protein